MTVPVFFFCQLRYSYYSYQQLYMFHPVHLELNKHQQTHKEMFFLPETQASHIPLI